MTTQTPAASMAERPSRNVVHSARNLPKAAALLEADAKIDEWDHSGMHPLHWAMGASYHDADCPAWLLQYCGLADIEGRRQFAADVHATDGEIDVIIDLDLPSRSTLHRPFLAALLDEYPTVPCLYIEKRQRSVGL